MPQIVGVGVQPSTETVLDARLGSIKIWTDVIKSQQSVSTLAIERISSSGNNEESNTPPTGYEYSGDFVDRLRYVEYTLKEIADNEKNISEKLSKLI